MSTVACDDYDPCDGYSVRDEQFSTKESGDWNLRRDPLRFLGEYDSELKPGRDGT